MYSYIVIKSTTNRLEAGHCIERKKAVKKKRERKREKERVSEIIIRFSYRVRVRYLGYFLFLPSVFSC